VITFADTSDRCIVEGRWQVLGPMPGFSHESWPIPPILAGENRIGWMDNDDLDIEYVDASVVSGSDIHLFDNPFHSVNADGMETGIPLALQRPDYHGAIHLTDERLEAWRRYAPWIRKALEQQKRKKLKR
jgi:hypothetical protein